MYKKAERLAKAIHLIAPAFADSPALRDRLDLVAVGLVDAAIQAPSAARTALSRELLTLSSVLAIARSSGLLSAMNADLMAREVHYLLQEVAAYEEPRLHLAEVPTLAELAKDLTKGELSRPAMPVAKIETSAPEVVGKAPAAPKGHIKDTEPKAAREQVKDRREAVLAVVRNKGKASIKDISHMVRGVSEKTVQRELAALVGEGVLAKQGERRWSVYSLA